ncbi:MAG: methyltransferase domain-containing protein [Propionibacteriales bacterium]|nr:methyltransferase domain-containing protein [Propionibacteriales bacterium]
MTRRAAVWHHGPIRVVGGHSCGGFPLPDRKVNKTFAVNKYEFQLSDEDMDELTHREWVGGMWDEIGRHQFDYLVGEGLKPEQRLLDVGCGAMRAGIHFAGYLDPGNYYGIDVNASLLRAAREKEMPAAGVSDRVPEGNLRETDMFVSNFGVEFDFALAQSLFTHLTLNHIRLCLWRVHRNMRPGGRFYATVKEFNGPPMREPRHQVKDPYFYRPADMRWLAQQTGWKVRWIGDWGHPRDQQMVLFTKPEGE